MYLTGGAEREEGKKKGFPTKQLDPGSNGGGGLSNRVTRPAKGLHVGHTHRKSTHVPARFNIPYNVMKPLSAYGPEASN